MQHNDYEFYFVVVYSAALANPVVKRKVTIYLLELSTKAGLVYIYDSACEQLKPIRGEVMAVGYRQGQHSNMHRTQLPSINKQPL